MRRTKIIATLGPSCDDEETIQQLLGEFILSEGGLGGGSEGSTQTSLLRRRSLASLGIN